MRLRPVPWLATLLAIVAGLPMLAGCLVGPRLLPGSAASYADAVRVAQSEQLLANLIRLRYRDLPVFLAVTDISTQFEVGAAGALGSGSGSSPDIAVGAGGSYAERPTISFSILGGEAFQKRLLAPLDVGAISLLVESGWRVDRVLRLCVEQMNGLANARTASGPTPSIAPEFAEFTEAASLLEGLRNSTLGDTGYRSERRTIGQSLPIAQVDGAALVAASEAGFQFDRTPGSTNSVNLATTERRLALRLSPESDRDSKVQRLRELLRLAPTTRTFDVVALDGSSFNRFEQTPSASQLAVDTRSLMGVLFYLSNGVEAPPEHVKSGVVTRTETAAGALFDWNTLLGDLVAIHSSRKEPKHAAIAVPYRDYWFYVADEDQATKSTFMLLSELFSLQAGELSRTRPVLTLPVGG